MYRCTFIVTSIICIARSTPRHHPQKRDQLHQSCFRKRNFATNSKESKQGITGNNYIGGETCGYFDYHVKVTITMLETVPSSTKKPTVNTSHQAGLQLVMYISLRTRVDDRSGGYFKPIAEFICKNGLCLLAGNKLWTKNPSLL